MARTQSLRGRRQQMQMMIEPESIPTLHEPEYIPRHMRPVVIEGVGLSRLRRLLDQLTDGTVYSIDMEVFTDGKKEE